jgi:hypothetical protein
MTYDQNLDMTAKAKGNQLFDRLKEASGLEPQETHGFAVAACQSAFGVLPIGDGLNRSSDAEIRALIPVIEAADAALALTVALLAVRTR